MFTTIQYIRYLLFSSHRNGRGIHSPFVFSLVSEILRNKIESDIVFSIEMIRKRMLADPRSIIVNDLGAGSKKMKSGLRKVSDIAKYSAVPLKYGILLSNMSKAFGKPYILEFGTSLGISTLYLAASCSDAEVVTMEGCKATSEIAKENFLQSGFSNIRLINAPFDEILPRLNNKQESPGLVFIDGNHRKEPVKKYFNHIADMSDNNCVVIIDDIYSSREMAEAWTEIKNHRNVTFTVDVFRMGIVFFRKGMDHFNYVVRY